MESPLTTKALLLFALGEGPSFGLDLMKRAERLAGGAVRVQGGSAYPALAVLSEEGLLEEIDGEQRASFEGGRRRRHYQITPAGTARLASWRALLLQLAGPPPAGDLSLPPPAPERWVEPEGT